MLERLKVNSPEWTRKRNLFTSLKGKSGKSALVQAENRSVSLLCWKWEMEPWPDGIELRWERVLVVEALQGGFFREEPTVQLSPTVAEPCF